MLHCRLPGGPQEEGDTCAGVQSHLAVQPVCRSQGLCADPSGVPQGTLITSMDTGSSRARTAPAPRSTPATSPTTLITSAVLSSTAWTRSCSRTTSRGRCEHHLLSFLGGGDCAANPMGRVRAEGLTVLCFQHQPHLGSPGLLPSVCVGVISLGVPRGWWFGASSHGHVVPAESITSAWTTWSETSSCAARWTRTASCPSH